MFFESGTRPWMPLSPGRQPHIEMSSIVHIGLWNNYDFGLAFSKVLTVSYRTSTIIITLLAILVTFAANRS
jgi:hypothetical protein